MRRWVGWVGPAKVGWVVAGWAMVGWLLQWRRVWWSGDVWGRGDCKEEMAEMDCWMGWEEQHVDRDDIWCSFSYGDMVRAMNCGGVRQSKVMGGDADANEMGCSGLGVHVVDCFYTVWNKAFPKHPMKMRANSKRARDQVVEAVCDGEY